MILPTINVVARPCGLPPNWFVASNSGDTYLISPVNTLVKDPSGCARESYDIDTGNFLGFLIESASTNLLGNSNRALTTANSWTISGGTVSVQNGTGLTDPDSVNGTNACSLVTPTSNGTAILTSAKSTASGIQANNKYTISVYAKSASVNTSTNIVFAINNTTNNVTKTINSTKWTRIYSGIKPTSTSSTLNAKLTISGAPVWLDYLQVEKGNLTSPIPGNNSTYTRSFDNIASISPSPFSSLFNATRGTVYIQYTLNDNALAVSNSVYGILSIGEQIKIAQITSDDSSPDSAIVLLPGVIETQGYSIVKILSNPTTVKLALSYESGEYPRISINGSIPLVISAYTSRIFQTSPTFPAINLGYVSSLNLSSYGSGGKTYTMNNVYSNSCLDGHLNHFAYFPSVLSDTDLVTLTTI